jgi:CDP-2,3-bis-(O-geranylgeranyl)-sn-glycerol synthase
MDILNLIVSSLYFMLPAYFGNMAPIIVKKYFLFLAKPIDHGLKFKGKPVFGKNKTWRGLIFGPIFGIITAYIQFKLNLSINIINYDYWLYIGFLMGFGALLGDIVESFFKRQCNVKPGQRFFPWDQVDFVIGALLLSFFFIPATIRFNVIITLLILSPLLHISVNHLAYYLKIRNEKW